MSEGELQALYKELDGVKVRGKGAPVPVRSWAQCGLASGVLAALKKAGFPAPLPIQAQSLPIIMSGRDCIAIAKTGSGKTLGFVLPLLRHIIDQPPIEAGDGPIGLIMAPTRELVQQARSSMAVYFSRYIGQVTRMITYFCYQEVYLQDESIHNNIKLYKVTRIGNEWLVNCINSCGHLEGQVGRRLKAAISFSLMYQLGHPVNCLLFILKVIFIGSKYPKNM